MMTTDSVKIGDRRNHYFVQLTFLGFLENFKKENFKTSTKPRLKRLNQDLKLQLQDSKLKDSTKTQLNHYSTKIQPRPNSLIQPRLQQDSKLSPRLN